MKKVLLLALMLMPFVANAQLLFKGKAIMDKFDDILSDKAIKTLITINDSTIEIEEKGSEPERYVILYRVLEETLGDENNIVRLVDNVYGCQETWAVVLEKDYSNFTEEIKLADDPDPEMRKKGIEHVELKYNISRIGL